MNDECFQRARSPQRKAERREAILCAARDLLDEGGPEAATLSAIAARAGVVKSGLYRYYESREEILIQLLVAGCEKMVAELERRAEALAASDASREERIMILADGMACAFASRPRFCQLVSIMSGTLENNISGPTILALKQRMHALHGRSTAAMRIGHGGLSHEAAGLAMRTFWGLVAGLWPMCHPGPRVAAALDGKHLPDFPRDFETALRAAGHAALLGAEAAVRAEQEGAVEAARTRIDLRFDPIPCCFCDGDAEEEPEAGPAEGEA